MSEAELLAPFNHIADQQGRGFRSAMIDAFNGWLKVPEEKTEKVKSIVNKLHTSSLVIDDIEDNSQLRRGVPVAHSIFGIAATLNSANYVYFLAMEEVIGLFDAGDDKRFRTVLTAVTTEMCNLHRGQGQDILFRDRGVPPTEEEYLSMVRDKTGGLFRLTVALLKEFSPDHAHLDFTPLLNNMGAYFQILDDYLNLASTTYHKSKTFCEDITEGKYSFVICHSLQVWRERGDERLHKIIRKCTDSVDLKNYAIQLMQETSSFDHTLSTLNRLHCEMLADIERLGGNVRLAMLLTKLHSQTQAPKKEEDESAPMLF